MKRKQKSWKFYLCLMGILLGTYFVIIAILAIRNPKKEPEPAVTVSSSSETETLPEEIPVSEEQKATITETPTPDVKEEEKEQTKTDPSDYGRDGKRYTVMKASDTLASVSVKVTNKEELSKIAGAAYDTIRSYLNIYAAHEGVDATEVTILDHVYIGALGERIEIYCAYNDEAETLVTVIFEPANEVHSSHVDVVPCQYTMMQIKKKAWLEMGS